MFLTAPFGCCRAWINFGPGEGVQKVSGLNSIYQLGFILGQFKNMLRLPNTTYADLAPGTALIWATLGEMRKGVPVPFDATAKLIDEFIEVLDMFKDNLAHVNIKSSVAGSMIQFRLNDVSTRMETIMAQELEMMPIWFVTKRRAYSIDILINNAEGVLDPDSIALLSKRTTYDMRQAGRALAFEVPTGAGFHAVRATEAVARGYHEIVVGLKPDEGAPLGPVIKGLRDRRDVLVGNASIDKEDLLHIVIEMLNRLNNVYRKPITHPDMVLDLSSALNVFDSAKCAIELMLEDAQKKHTGSIPVGFF